MEISQNDNNYLNFMLLDSLHLLLAFMYLPVMPAYKKGLESMVCRGRTRILTRFDSRYKKCYSKKPPKIMASCIMKGA